MEKIRSVITGMMAVMLLAALWGQAPLAAQSTIKVQAPNMVAADEQFNVAFIIEGEKAPSAFSWDPGNDFQLVWGPQKGTSTSVSIVNGKTTRSSQTTYTYILQPKSVGKFTLSSATATVKGGTLRSDPFTVEVLSGGQQQSQSGQTQAQSSGSSAATGDIAASDLYLQLSLSRSNVVVGEPVTATLKLYQRVNIAGFEDAKFPTFNGFWSQEVQAPTNINFQRENVGGEIYNSAVLRSWVIIPQQAGSISIDPAELVCLVNVRKQSSSRSIFDSFFDDGYQTIRKRIYSDKRTVKVSPLPAGAPASFTGGVGSFTIQAKLSKDTLKAHEAASIELTVSGRGNISLVEAPKVSLPVDFEAYDVKSTDLSDKSTGRTSGARKFEYPFIPRSYGDFTIDPVQFSYYDVNTHKYVTLSTQPMPIHVERGAQSGAQQDGAGQMVQGVTARDVRNLGSDIRYIKTRVPSFDSAGSFLCARALYWVVMALCLVAAAAVWALRRRTVVRRADVVGTRHRRASSMARKRLSAAGDFLKKDLYTAFYEELHKTLLGYVGDKLNIDLADMSKEHIRERLVGAGAGEELSDKYIALLDACEYARYAPDAGHDAMDAHYHEALEVISNIEEAMKGHARTASRAGGGAAAAIAAALLVSGITAQGAWAQEQPVQVGLAQEDALAQGQAGQTHEEARVRGLSAQSATAQSYPDSLWSAGVDAYAQGLWGQALDDWRKIASLGVESVDLYYNMGNACFKQGDISHAILWYERALKIDPSDADSRNNLAFANGFVQDHIDVVPEFFLKQWVRKMSYIMGSDAWAVVGGLMFAVMLALALVFLLSGRRGARQAGFFGAIAALLLMALSLGCSFSQRADYFRADKAIVVSAVTSAKSAPGSETSADLFVLHEGTKVRILDTVGDWLRVEISDGRQGWLPSNSLEVI